MNDSETYIADLHYRDAVRRAALLRRQRRFNFVLVGCCLIGFATGLIAGYIYYF